MANYNVAFPVDGYQFTSKYLYSCSTKVLTPTGSDSVRITWSYGSEGDTVDLDIDYYNTTTQHTFTLNSPFFPIVNKVRYEHLCFVGLNSDGTLEYALGTANYSNSTYDITFSVPQTASSPRYPYTLYFAVHKRRAYIATFDSNGGSGGPSNVSFLSGNRIVIPSQVPELEGNAFSGWSYGGNIYQPGETSAVLYTESTFVAVWTKTYTITFDPNGGTGGPEEIVFASGSSVTIPSTIPVKSGYRFIGWSDDGGITMYYPNEVATFNGDTTLVAVWSSSPTPPSSDMSDTLARLPSSDSIAYRPDTNSLVYNT